MFCVFVVGFCEDFVENLLGFVWQLGGILLGWCWGCLGAFCFAHLSL